MRGLTSVAATARRVALLCVSLPYVSATGQTSDHISKREWASPGAALE